MKKRILSLCMALALCLTLLPASAFATDGGTASVALTAVSANPEGNPNENYTMLFDSNAYTKWCVEDFTGSATVIFQTSEPVVMTGYSFRTGWDSDGYPGRNPKSWTLYGSSDNVNWAEIQVVTDGQMPKWGTKSYSVDNEAVYRYYKFQFTATAGDTIFQLAEISITAKACPHSWKDDSTTAPACAEEGYTLQICSVCGATQTVNIIPAAGHKWENSGEPTQQPTCSINGSQPQKCSVCNATQDAPILALGHNWDQNGNCTRCDAKSSDYAAELRTDSGVVYYTSLRAALDAAQETPGSTVKLLRDYSVTKIDELKIEKGAFTIDLNGRTIDMEDYYAIFPVGDENGANLTIINSADTAAKLYSHLRSLLSLNDKNSKVTIGAANTETKIDLVFNKVAVNVRRGTLEIYGGTFTRSSSGNTETSMVQLDGGTLAIHGGTFEAGVHAFSGNLIITGGEFKPACNGAYALYSECNASISGGVFHGISSSVRPADLLADGYAFSAAKDDPAQIIRAGKDCESGNGYVIEGTIYVVKHASHTYDKTTGECICGKLCPHVDVDKNGNCTYCGQVGRAILVTKADGTPEFPNSFAETIGTAASNPGSTVKLLKDATSERNIIYQGCDFTVDLNGKTLREANSLVNCIFWLGSNSDQQNVRLINTADTQAVVNAKGVVSIKNGSFTIGDAGGKNSNIKFDLYGDKLYQTENLEKFDVVINGGIYTNSKCTPSANVGRLKINGGEFQTTVTDGYGLNTNRSRSLSGGTYHGLTTGGGTIADLLADGYGYQKSDGSWLTVEETSVQSTHETLTVKKAPIESLKIKINDAEVSGTYETKVETELHFTAETAPAADTVTWTVNGDSNSGSFTPAAAGTYTLKCTAVKGTYTVVKTVTVRATQTTPKLDGNLTLGNDGIITYGQPLSEISISGTMKDGDSTVAGTFKWSRETEKPDANDSYEAEWTFTPESPAYSAVTGKATIKVNKADPICVAPTGVSAVYGQKLRDITLNNPDGNTPGKWTWTEDEQSVGNVGERVFKADFTPNDSKNYNAQTKIDVNVTVGKADGSVTAPVKAADLVYTGESQTLIAAGSSTTGEVQYSLDGKNYSTQLPTGTEAGKYTVYYRVLGDDNHFDVAPAYFEVVIERQPVRIPAEDTTQFTYNGEDQTYTIASNDNYTVAGSVKKNAGSYTVTVRLKDTKNFVWSDGSSEAKEYAFTITAAKVTITVRDKSAYVGDAAPDLSKPALDKDYTVSGLIDGDKLTGTLVLKYTDTEGNEIFPDMTRPGRVAIKAGGAESSNYTISYVNGNLTILLRPSADDPAVKTETTTNPDGSTTKTETRPDGTVIETTTNKDGSTTRTETKPDGSSKTEVKDASGSTGTVRTDKNGQTTAEAKVSDKAVSDAKKSDEAVKIPAEVTPGADSASAPTVKIDLPGSSGETKIEIPVKGATSGTVAIIVKPDGTEEIVKDSVPTKDGIRLIVDGDVTVKIVNNARDFTDVNGHWAKESIDFVSARGLVNGTGSATFSPDAPTTRAQLWTILARQDNADLTGGGSWYEKAQAWVKASGISDGSDPSGVITRAQMVTMLWRAAGSPEVTNAATFTDVPAGSYYAKAVAWAVENGITTGIGNGKFDPNGTCTRAQIAAFLHRSYLSR